MGEFVVGFVGGVALEDIHDEAFFNSLSHGVLMSGFSALTKDF